MKRIILPAALAIVSFVCHAQTEVAPYVAGKSADAVTYFLPRSVVEIEVEAEQVAYTPGEFCKYAERYLRLTNLPSQAETHWELVSIHAASVGVPDPEQVYSVRLKDKSIAPLLGLTADGIIHTINLPAPKEPIAKTEPQPEGGRRPVNPRDYMTEEMLMANSTARVAELVAKEIYNIRESRNAIIRGQADNMPKDGEALKLMLAQLDEQEGVLMQLFTGTTVRQRTSVRLRLTPRQGLDKEVLFRFSRKLGVLDKDDLAGTPIYVSLTDLHTVPPYTLDEKSRKKPAGIVYNVPGQARLHIYSTTQTYVEQNIVVTQFGHQEILADDLFNKRTDTRVTFDIRSGALLHIGRE